MKVHTNPSPETWAKLCARPAAGNAGIARTVKHIIARVRRDGDDALRALSAEIDGIELGDLQVSEAEFEEAAAKVSDSVKIAVAHAISNIAAFHQAQMPKPVKVTTAPGVNCWQKPVPISTVGLYIPGGTAPLFSTVLMLAVPAKVAGCPETVLCTPVSRKTGKVAPEVLYAAQQCGIDKVFKAGGAQAVAAMAFGTQSIPRVDKIFGPGNRFVTTAKQMLGGSVVAIDMPAGPSEVMVLADSSAKPAFVAADLLSQAEHGADSQVMLVCDSAGLAAEVAEEVEKQTAALGRADFVRKALEKSRTVVFTGDCCRADMLAFANAYAPEHLIISMRDPWQIADGVTAAGSVFVGNWSPESAGDYASGTNHTLPTSAWARSYSGVNIDSFIRKITYQELTRKGLEALGGTIVSMAEAEGLQAHANAVKIRLGK